MQIAMRACGVQKGDPVLTNAFTLAPVPGAISAVGACAVFVEIDEALRLDLDDLERKIAQSGARFLLLSHMRGHLCDMERLMDICDAANVVVIEDCAHTMGARWNGKRSGNFGKVACFSTQTYKHMNSGEGGLLTTQDEAVAARATILSGSYMLFDRHGAGPQIDAFSDAKLEMPNCSARMDHLRAAILRPQLKRLDDNIKRWNVRYQTVERKLATHKRIKTISRPAAEAFVGSSIQFLLPGFSNKQCKSVLSLAAERGVELKWFGAPDPVGFTSSHQSWAFVERQDLPQSDSLMEVLFDMRIPLTFTEEDCSLVGSLLCEALDEI
jgi:dTDP-4-amino-4,6-dideoxygalactose transaminase